ncbi:MAG: hypothetical protein LBR53_01455 [Deltaproteobacteria bacterium]|nr:hypothetical protein [Deltaproteobacteria bacterium]
MSPLRNIKGVVTRVDLHPENEDWWKTMHDAGENLAHLVTVVPTEKDGASLSKEELELSGESLEAVVSLATDLALFHSCELVEGDLTEFSFMEDESFLSEKESVSPEDPHPASKGRGAGFRLIQKAFLSDEELVRHGFYGYAGIPPAASLDLSRETPPGAKGLSEGILPDDVVDLEAKARENVDLDAIILEAARTESLLSSPAGGNAENPQTERENEKSVPAREIPLWLILESGKHLSPLILVESFEKPQPEESGFTVVRLVKKDPPADDPSPKRDDQGNAQALTEDSPDRPRPLTASQREKRTLWLRLDEDGGESPLEFSLGLSPPEEEEGNPKKFSKFVYQGHPLLEETLAAMRRPKKTRRSRPKAAPAGEFQAASEREDAAPENPAADGSASGAFKTEERLYELIVENPPPDLPRPAAPPDHPTALIEAFRPPSPFLRKHDNPPLT